MTCIALIVAAGRGSRFGGDIPKQYQTLDGLPVLRHAVHAFRSHPQVTQVGVVIHPDDRALYDNAVGDLDLLPPISGGAERQESARYGLEALATSPPATVLIHDAARPRTPPALIGRVIDALATHAAVVPVLPIVDTVKQSTTPDSQRVSTTLDRRCLWRAQTPQGFRYPEILAAHRRFAGMTLTDDAAVAEQAGLEVAMVAGDDANLKLTEIADIDRITGHASYALEHRTGQGFDVHRFAPGDRVYLCGVEIPHVASLEGHSDADVALHALTDALLGAVGAGDIGLHFPPSDPQWRGAPSHLFLTRAAEIVAERGARVVNVDVTIICERPKVGPHRDAMQARIAELLAVEIDRVNVKATTTERLGFTGRGEGIAAQAIATLALPMPSGRG